jgi:hypothetical protein
VSAHKLEVKKLVLGLAIMAALAIGLYHMLPSPTSSSVTPDEFNAFYNEWQAEGRPCGAGMGRSNLLLGYARESNAPDSIVQYIEAVCQ